MRACITPEHRVHNKNYTVNCLVEEDKGEILKAFCEDCAACEGKGTFIIIFHFFLSSFNVKVVIK